MIVWLASYPRSGNTLLRMLIRQTFGLRTYSQYDDLADIGADPEMAEVVGHSSHAMGTEFVGWARSQPELVLAKTHEPAPDDPDPAIYVVRDGRAATVSYMHYLRDIAGQNVELSDVLEGRVWRGNWSAHVESWLSTPSGPRLLLRFEDLVADPSEAMERTGAFLNLRPGPVDRIDFADLKRRFPKFFRSGSNQANLSEMTPTDQELFWRTHGKTTRSLGYA